MTVIAPSAGNSALNPEQKDVFSSEDSILRALSFVRHSPIPVKDKDAFRDLFLSYTGTYEEKDRSEIKSKIIELMRSKPELSSLLPAKETRTELSRSADGIGSARPVPSFSVAATKIAVPDEPPPAASVPKEDKAKPTPPPKPPEPTAQKVAPPPPVAEPISAPAPTPEPRIMATPGPSGVDIKVRINDIKRAINSKFGNPVNLIDQNEQVGREYMTALLDAMKRSAKGDNDISRLENAYQAALKVSPDTEQTSVTTPSPTPNETPVETTAVPKIAAVTPETVIAAPEPIKVEVPPTPAVEPTPVKAPAEAVPPKTFSGLYHQPADEINEPAPAAPTKKSGFSLAGKLLKPETASDLKETAPVTEKPDTKASTPIPPNPPAAPAREISVAKKTESPKSRPVKDIDTTLPEQISKLKAAAAAREEAAKRPIVDLNAPEIDQGLKQLLSEWSLFKGGGFFRTRPSGIDSALYKQLAKLPMASVVAGRFEGVTPEIKRELADYMTGWRYERGIVHEMGETFEHYLRRVVKEILEKQRKATAAKSDEKK